jgi:putative flippase GtrA
MLLNFGRKKAVKFLVAGSVNFLFGYSIYAFFIILGVSYSLALLAATTLGICFNYFTVKKFVFESSKNAFILFVIGYVFQYILGVFLLGRIILVLDNELVAGICTMPILSVFSFIANSWIFNDKK